MELKSCDQGGFGAGGVGADGGSERLEFFGFE